MNWGIFKVGQNGGGGGGGGGGGVTFHQLISIESHRSKILQKSTVRVGDL